MNFLIFTKYRCSYCDRAKALIKQAKLHNKIINDRIEDGQLSDCPITLDELKKIKGKIDGNTGMLPVLRGIYHIRVEYPDEVKK